jgi:hypothetical protein
MDGAHLTGSDGVDEVQAPDLIDGHINMTVEKTTKRIRAMKHDVMFIDEASQLLPKNKGETHFGYEYVLRLRRTRFIPFPPIQQLVFLVCAC